MPQQRIRAAFIRGGTSKGVFFRREDLPVDRAEWDPIFLAALGSPDPSGRQLNGLGGGISSLSKVMVVAASDSPEIDVEYTFGQVSVGEPTVDYRNNCGNLTSAIGPFAIDEGLASVEGGVDEAVVRLFNTNTQKRITARFALDGAEAAVEGDFELQGVSGSGSPVRVEFEDPGGAVTGKLLPTGRPCDVLSVPGLGDIEASIVDATTSVAFVRASEVGVTATELPDALEADVGLLKRLQAIRESAALLIGVAATPAEARQAQNTPFIALVGPPAEAATLSGGRIASGDIDVHARAISMGRPHRALPLTGALCLAVAARIEGTVVHEVASGGDPGADLRIGTPSGVLPLAAEVRHEGDRWVAERAVAYRTVRRLMEGSVLVPASTLRGGTR